MVEQTRIGRRQKQIKVRKRKMFSLVGTGLVITPVAAVFTPQTRADQYQTTASLSNSFVDQIAASASQIAAGSDLYASVMIAQAILESGHGNSSLSSAPNYNLFGIKAYSGETAVWMSTKEYVNGKWTSMNEPFRVYGSYYESLQDHANLLRSYYQGAWKSQTSSYLDATSYLTGRYATDPSYGQKLNQLIQNYNLTQYDTPSQGYSIQNTSYQGDQNSQNKQTSYESSQQSQNTQKQSHQTSSSSTYIVRKGDTLWDISQRYGISLDSLMANNGLTSDVIMVGQQLKL